MIKDLTLATHNPHKLQEFQDYLAPLGIKVHSEKEFVKGLEVEETGKSYEENALLKAKAILPYSPYPVLADDSGIEIDALGQHFPGIYSARYLESLASTSLEADRSLLEKMKGEKNRKAAFHCALVLLEKDTFHSFEGICEGEILGDIKGEKGFGYDPIFFVPSEGKTAAELTREEKSAISHRGQALKLLLDALRNG